ncbi:hypothetical protein CJU90_6559 [Yarrowia sp. C11]|nr:hypothetical protein CJU90_6559 [Yarrowia sp. C11]KAG5371259.1 hypothetical protein CKK34_1399 [Yarrowia sp. E02]
MAPAPTPDRPQAMRRLRDGDGYQFVRWSLKRGDDKWLYVNWNGCNPAMISRFNRSDFNDQEYRDIALRSPGYFEEPPETLPVVVPPMPEIPDRVEELFDEHQDAARSLVLRVSVSRGL